MGFIQALYRWNQQETYYGATYPVDLLTHFALGGLLWGGIIYALTALVVWVWRKTARRTLT